MLKVGDAVFVKLKKVNENSFKMVEAIVDKVTKKGDIKLLISDFSCSIMEFNKNGELMDSEDYSKDNYESAEILEYNIKNKRQYDKQNRKFICRLDELIRIADAALKR